MEPLIYGVVGHIDLPQISDQRQLAIRLAELFGNQFAKKLDAGFLEVRFPLFGNIRWHKDMGKMDDRWMMLWASANPTEIRSPYGDIFQGKPGELVLFDNFRCTHRTPPSAAELNDPNRWTVRMGCFQGRGGKLKVSFDDGRR